MPPADEATPDFDSMSPEELMAWMETLAERQGASEGFTTEQRMDIAEVDPTTVEETGPGYIPYGMSEEDWAKKQAEEEAQKAARQQTTTPEPTPAPPAPTVTEPEPEPAPVASADGGTPDFDSMSPEELMAWMETLAERQGASEGFTTEQRMDIAEVDPTTVEDTGPGYIPYGMGEEEWAEKLAKEEAQKAARQQAQAQEPAPQPPEPAFTEPEPATETAFSDLDLPTLDLDSETSTDMSDALDLEPAGLDWLESLAADQGADIPQMDLSGLGDVAPLNLDALGAPDDEEEAVTADPVQWLDNLSGGGDEENVFDLPTSDPVTPTPQFEATVPDSDASGDDPINWLESLARDQGADPEEFTTAANLDVSGESASGVDQAPGYEPYAFENDTISPANLDEIDQLDAVVDQNDPIAWLDNLATSQSQPIPETSTQEAETSEPIEQPEAGKTSFKDDPLVQESLSQGGLMDQLTKGDDVSSDDVRNWMDNLLSQGIKRDDSQGFQIPEEDESELAEPEANIPDWLVEQVGPPPDLDAPVAEEAEPASPVFDENIVEPQNEVDIPDWLQAEAGEADSTNLEDIFASADESDQALPIIADVDPQSVTDEIAIQSNDPWVEAFELEGTDGLSEWYDNKLQETQQDAGEIAQQAVTQQPVVNLQPAQFESESNLTEGELQAVPSWLNDLATDQPDAVAVPTSSEPASQTPAFDMPSGLVEEEDAAVSEMPDWLMQMDDSPAEAVTAPTSGDSDMPDWLKEAGVEEDADVPGWLKDTITTEEEIVTPEQVLSPVPPNQIQQAPPPQTTAPVVAQVPQSPAPVPAPSAMDPADAAQALQGARSKIKGGDVMSGLDDYEAIIRANAQLDAVVDDLSKMVKDKHHKENAAVHRILGDGLMRQGRLQEALNTYRKALNLL